MIPADIDVRALELAPSHAFVLSHIDGMTTLDELVQVVPFPEEQAIEILRDLHDRGLIALPAGATRATKSPGEIMGRPRVQTPRPRRPSAPYIEVRRERNSTPLPNLPGPTSSNPQSTGNTGRHAAIAGPPEPATPKTSTGRHPVMAAPGDRSPTRSTNRSDRVLAGSAEVPRVRTGRTGLHTPIVGPPDFSAPPSSASTAPPQSPGVAAAPTVSAPTPAPEDATTRTPLAVDAVPPTRRTDNRPTPSPQSAPVDAQLASVEYAEPGAIIADRYRLLKRIGQGGMGIVFLAEHVVLEKQFALKILNDDMARRPELVQRFLLEAKATSRIVHENIVDIVDFGQTSWGSVYFAMEYLRGEDLASYLRRKRTLDASETRYIGIQVCRALEAAHDRGVVHRDVKPANIFLTERDGHRNFVKVLDFGIAKLIDLDKTTKPGERLTRAGMVFGTPEYIAPEQARGDAPVAAPADIYSVGCILYELLTGDVPFADETIMKTLLRQMLEIPEPPSQRAPSRNIPPDLEAVIMKALAKEPGKRFATMKEMAAALTSCVA